MNEVLVFDGALVAERHGTYQARYDGKAGDLVTGARGLRSRLQSMRPRRVT